jgi:Fic family protein
LDWFLGCLARSFKRAELALDAVFHKARMWERVNAHGVNDRQRLVLTRLLDDWQGNLTSIKYATIAKCSPDTALRDITLLLDAGVLAKNDGGGRSASYRLAD